MKEINYKLLLGVVILSFMVSSVSGGVLGFYAGTIASGSDANLSTYSISKAFFSKDNSASTDLATSVPTNTEKTVVVSEESAVIDVVKKTNDAVVSIIVTKDLPVIEKYYRSPSTGSDLFDRFFGSDFGGLFSTPEYRQNGTETQEIGGGTGFLVSSDGYIITNKHVVDDDDASYTVLMNDETKYEATILARDTYNDIAILKIDGNDFPYIELGDSSNLQVGQTVVTIGNSLGEFRNTVSTGVISGLARDIVAGDTAYNSEELVDVIQTDSAINPGNSGGPLLNIQGQAIGINTAIAQDAENIGFALPINIAKDIFDSVKTYGKIVRPWLGVRYLILDEDIAIENELNYAYGALLVRGQSDSDLAVITDSPADKAGLVEDDIILEIEGEKINSQNTLVKLMSKYRPGEEISLKIYHEGKEQNISVVLEEMNEDLN